MNQCPFSSGGVPRGEMPDRIKKLPVLRGFPVPWFVAKVDGEFDFRISDQAKLIDAIRFNLCWVCGERLGANKVFVIGPMCGINRTSAEPPAHYDCARYAVQFCPFLSRPNMKRREDEVTERFSGNVPGHGLKRNPGASGLWVTKSFKRFRPPNGGVLFEIGKPERVEWYAEGRPATRAEVEASIESGIHHLEAACEMEATPERVAEARAELAKMRADLETLLPEA